LNIGAAFIEHGSCSEVLVARIALKGCPEVAQIYAKYGVSTEYVRDKHSYNREEVAERHIGDTNQGEISAAFNMCAEVQTP
jgi:hypothetical protein